MYDVYNIMLFTHLSQNSKYCVFKSKMSKHNIQWIKYQLGFK